MLRARPSSRRSRQPAWLLLLLVVAPSPLIAQPEEGARIMVGPNYLVSRDGDRPHVEIMAAANPRNPRNLLAGAIVFSRPDGGPMTKAYVSHDGGIAWRDVAFPEQQEVGGADPQVAFSGAGTAIFLTLAMAEDETGRTRGFLHTYRSEDEGRTWADVLDLGASYDHPMLAADHSTGRFAGRLYVSVLYGGIDYRLGVFRSEDDGRSWIGPVQFAEGGGTRGLNVDPMLVFHDGAVMAPFIDFPFTPEQTAEWTGSRIWTVVSTDGGVTFSEPRPGPAKMTGDEIRASRTGEERFRLGAWVLYAIDRSERFRDRVYAVWPDFGAGPPRVVITWTDDRGDSWTDPKPVSPGAPEGSRQFQPAVAVNRDGVLGLTWYDTRGTSSNLDFHQVFAASFDGGETFTPPQPVSSEVSRPLAAGNLVANPTTFTGTTGELRVALLSPASRYLSGGDYMGLTTTPEGDFHPVWADARGQAYQIHTARVRVVDAPAPSAASAGGGEPVDVTAKIALVNDPGSYDAETGVLDLRIRLENISAAPIHGPIEVELRDFGSGMGDVFADLAPEVLNADNGERGRGARFVYDAALGSGRILLPGGVSGARRWSLRLRDPIRVPDLHVHVAARDSP